MKIKGSTKVLGIIGNPVEHSMSPIIHNEAIKEKGLNYVFVPFLSNDPKGAISAVRALNIKGLAVTIPFKKDIIPYLDELDEIGKASKSINTVINEEGKLIGTNTDGLGAIRALKEKTSLEGKRILILGNGGSAQGISKAILIKEKVSALIVSGRNKEKLSSMVEALKEGKGSDIVLSVLMKSEDFNEELARADIIINTTPLGMHKAKDETPLDKALIKSSHTVFDIVYTPKETRLIKEAKEKGASVVYGYKMLLYQGVLQFEKWTNTEAPLKVMEKSLLNALGD